jgi:zinc carboxypeptidase
MHSYRSIAYAVALVPAILSAQAPRTTIPSPRQHLGFDVGADRTLADWGQITGYFQRLAAASPAVHVDTLGPTTNGQPFIVAAISTPANIARLTELRAAQAKLADPRRLTPDEERRLVASQPSVIFISNNIHGSEIGGSQMAMELAYRLATNDTLQRYLQREIVLIAPSMNPDGQRMITEWYRKNLGTRWEGGPLPWLYHPYVGHDNNRDWFMVTQKETRLVTDYLYGKWFPEIFYDVHQMGAEGARIFVPPLVDPVNPNLDPMIVRGIAHIGAEMALALEERGKSGVANSVIYDLWWHGGARSTPTRHNMVGVITEAASVRIATPIVQDTSQLRGHARGLPKYERRINFPNPWPGGTWRLRDIIDYELIAAEALVRLASEQREDYVRSFVAMGRRAIDAGSKPPYAFVIPAGQGDAGAVERLVDVLRVGRVEVGQAKSAFTVGGATYGAGSYVVRMNQPYRAHAKDLLEVQRFPRMEQYPGGPPERPYDVAGWTLPLQMGVTVAQIDQPLDVQMTLVTDASPRTRCTARAGAAMTDAAIARDTRQYACLTRTPRVGLYKSWTANMDEGWTRWVMDDFKFPYVSVGDSAIRAGGLRKRFDVIVIPDLSLREVQGGMSEAQVPPPYQGGVGADGLTALKQFVEEGGHLVLVDGATELAPAALGIDVKLVRAGGGGGGGSRNTATDAEQIYAPGSILRVLVDPTHPVGRGMSDSSAIYFVNSMSLDFPAGTPARVIARYPSRAESILLSGFLQGAPKLAGKVAAADIALGTGRVTMFGFRPLYRGQSYGTFKMFFNALLESSTTQVQ